MFNVLDAWMVSFLYLFVLYLSYNVFIRFSISFC